MFKYFCPPSGPAEEQNKGVQGWVKRNDKWGKGRIVIEGKGICRLGEASIILVP